MMIDNIEHSKSDSAAEYTFSNEVLIEIVRLVQLGILTGTDVSDNLRLIRVRTTNAGTVTLTDGYMISAAEGIERLLKQAGDANRKRLMPDGGKAN